MLQGVFKFSLIFIMLLCSVSAAIFGSSCSAGLLDAPVVRAQMCSMTQLDAPVLPAETTEHVSMLVVQVAAIVSVVLAVLLRLIEVPRVIGAVETRQRNDRLQWIWASPFRQFFSQSISIPYLRATRGA